MDEQNYNNYVEEPNNKEPYLSSNVKDILKRRREDKKKKGKRKNIN